MVSNMFLCSPVFGERFPIGLIFFSAGLKPRVCFRVVLVLPPGVCCFAEEDSKIVVELVALLSSIVANARGDSV